MSYRDGESQDRDELPEDADARPPQDVSEALRSLAALGPKVDLSALLGNFAKINPVLPALLRIDISKVFDGLARLHPTVSTEAIRQAATGANRAAMPILNSQALQNALAAANRAAMSNLNSQAMRDALTAANRVATPHVWSSSVQDAIRRAWHVDFDELLEQFTKYLPPNWPHDADEEAVEEIVNDGIPLVWVPRSEITQKLLDAKNRAERIGILLAHRTEVAEDCRVALREASHAEVADQVALGMQALDAFNAGLDAPAQSLAVVVTDTVVRKTFSDKPSDLHKNALVDLDDVPYQKLRLLTAMAPVSRFYTRWFPTDPTPPPAHLSRHVSVHVADGVHYTEENAILAVMLMASLLRQLSDFHGEEDAENAS